MIFVFYSYIVSHLPNTFFWRNIMTAIPYVPDQSAAKVHTSLQPSLKAMNQATNVPFCGSPRS